jgi:hypothetical protein
MISAILAITGAFLITSVPGPGAEVHQLIGAALILTAGIVGNHERKTRRV